MDRRALQLELLCSRGCLAPEDLCKICAVSHEWRGYADAEASWQTVAKVVTLRPLPVSLETGAAEASQESAKWQLLQRYRPAFKVRRQVLQLLKRIAGFWQLWSPAVALALRQRRRLLSEAQLQRLEQRLDAPLPEDFAEFLRWCDGFEVEAFWFAEAQPGALAFRVARLLCAEEMLQKAQGTPPGWIPIACSREGAFTCLRLQETESTAAFGELWCGAAPRGDFDLTNLTRQSTSFIEYLKDYVGLLESIPQQYAQEQLLTPGSLSQVLPQLFSCNRIYCDERSSWVTTGRMVGQDERVASLRDDKRREDWETSRSKCGKELQAEVFQAKSEKRSFEAELNGQKCKVLGWEQTCENFLQENSKLQEHIVQLHARMECESKRKEEMKKQLEDLTLRRDLQGLQGHQIVDKAQMEQHQETEALTKKQLELCQQRPADDAKKRILDLSAKAEKLEAKMAQMAQENLALKESKHAELQQQLVDVQEQLKEQKKKEEDLVAQHVTETLRSNEEISKLEAQIQSLKERRPDLSKVARCGLSHISYHL
eukprot:s424_g26.t1